MTQHMDVYAEAGITHDVVIEIGGQRWGFMLFDKNYQHTDVSDFAPHVSTGPKTKSDMHIWETWTQESWDHGFGFPKWSDDAGYLRSGEGVDTRQNDIVTLATELVSSETGVHIVKFVDFNNNVYGLYGSDSGVRKYTVSAGTWAATSETSGAMNDGLSTGDYLVVCPDGARMRKMNAAGTFSNVGVDGNPPNDMSKICLHGGYLWAAQDGTSFLHYASELDFSDMEGGGESDAGVIVVGPGSIPIVNMISFNKNLYVAREDALYIVDSVLAYNIIDYSRERHSQNFEAMAGWQGKLYYGIRQRLYAYTGSTVIDVTPPRYTDTFPYNEYGRFKYIEPRGKYLYVVARNNESAGTDDLLVFDGVGWHRLWTLGDNPDVVRAMNLTTVTDYLWVNTDAGTGITKYYRMQTLSELPYDDYETTGVHYLYSSKFSAGFDEVEKYFHSLFIESENLSSVREINVAYQIDSSGTWTTLGSFTTSPTEEIDFPAETTGKTIQLRFDLQTDDGEQTPVMDTVVLKYIMRPATIWAHQMMLYLADNQQTLARNIEAQPTALEKKQALETMRDSVSPFTFWDPNGVQQEVYCSSIKELEHSMKEATTQGREDVEWRVQVALIDAD